MSEELHNDVGHGVNTYPPSKGVPGLPEHTFNAAVGHETKRLLRGLVPTFEAQPFNGPDVPLITRTNLYNSRWLKNKDAIGISDHANANSKPSVRGFGVFYWHRSPEAKKLAEILLDEYKKEFPDREAYPIWGTGLFPSVPNTWTDLHMCRETKGVFVLVEWEFMTNPEAYKLLKSDDYRKRCALVKAKSVCRWYGIKWTGSSENKVTLNSNDRYMFKTGWFRDDMPGLARLENFLKENGWDYSKVKEDKKNTGSYTRYMFKTGWFRDGTAGLIKMESFIKENGWDYTKVKEKHVENAATNDRYMFKTGWFRNDMPGLSKLEKFLKENNWHYTKVKEKK